MTAITALSKLFQAEEPIVITIPTFAPTTSTTASMKEIEPKSLKSSDLKALKNDDPFMYYSIPQVRGAEFRLEEVDTSKINEPPRKKKCRPRENEDDAEPSKTVKRRSRISFECHADLVLDETLAKTVDGHEEESFIDFDPIMNWLESRYG